MGKRILSGILDVLTGLGAIVLVLALCIGFHRIGMSFTSICALTGLALLAAGILRGSPARKGYLLRLLRIVAPGLLGICAIVVASGLHLFAILVGLTALSLFAAGLGFAVRVAWPVNRKRSTLMTGATIAVIAAVAFLVVPHLTFVAAFEADNTQLPAFNLSAGGRQIPSSSLRGHVVVMAFWATWCAPCIQELPHIQRVYAHYQNNPTVAFYAVDLGWNDETAAKGQQFFAKRKIDLPLAFDQGDAAQSLNVRAIPAVIMVDSSGKVRFRHIGYSTAENMESALTTRIDTLLADARPQPSAQASSK